MAKDSNRGRDLPRGAQYVKQKGLRDAQTEENNKKAALAQKAQKLKSDLAKIVNRRGYDQLLFAPNVGTEKMREKERKVVLSCLAHNIHVHPRLLAEFGLEAEPNPPTNYEDDGKAPF